MKNILKVFVFILIIIWTWNKLLIPGWDKYVKKYDKPWWSGTEYQKVCGTEEYEDKCYTLAVYSDGESIDTIYFDNGGYLNGESECFKAASGLYDFERFCRFYDQESRLWDVIPL